MVKRKEIDTISTIFNEMELIAIKKIMFQKDVSTLINYLTSENTKMAIQNSDDLVILNSHRGAITAKTEGQKNIVNQF